MHPVDFDQDQKLLMLHKITKQLHIKLRRIKTPNDFSEFTRKRQSGETRKGSKPYTCSQPNCDFKTALSGNLRVHMFRHSKDKPFICPVCSKAFKFPYYIKQHIAVIHSDEKKFACPFPGCHMKFRHACSLKPHSYTHTGEKPFKCSICGYKTRQKGHLNEHMQLHGAKGRTYRCDKCDFVTRQSGGLQNHSLRMHPKSSEKPFKCSHSQCKFASFLKSKLKEHLKIHSENKPYSCSFCEYKGITGSHLNSHMRSHTGEKPFSCSQCDYTAASNAAFNNHFNTRHKKRPENYKCGLCSKICFSEGGLNSHMRTHTGEKPFFCTFCGRDFSHNGPKQRHEKSCQLRMR